eukprot:TRINITY_DN3428_c0_g1_i1.p1 TRINITY_DN3428_c0_g1~~TRINITY_DN3428_c0_g1_i1.p1  ORF type:complete len:513 (+),score=131.44 TRINITY_DN3428_c0_g1_i1:139-1677(+)
MSDQQDALPSGRRRRQLKYMRTGNLDANYVTSQAGRNLANAVRSPQKLLESMDALKLREHRRAPAGAGTNASVSPESRRLSLQLASPGRMRGDQDALPVGGRRMTSVTATYEPAAQALRQRAEAAAAMEEKGQEEMNRALARWKADATSDCLDLSSAALDDGDFLLLARMLRDGAPPFTLLDLSGGVIGDASMRHVMQSLCYSALIAELRLAGAHITRAGAEMLQEMVYLNRYLQTLDVRAVKAIDGPVAEALLDCLWGHPHLRWFNGLDLWELQLGSARHLDLSCQGLGLVEAVAAARYLALRGDGLRSVDLSNNNLTSEAAQMLVAALAERQTRVRGLVLANNLVDAACLPCLAELLRRCPHLSRIDLTENRLQGSAYDAGGLLLLSILQTHTKLVELKLDGNAGVDATLLRLISEKLAVNAVLSRHAPSLEQHVKARLAATAEHPEGARDKYRREVAALRSVDQFFMLKEAVPVKTLVWGGQRAEMGAKGGVAPLSPFAGDDSSYFYIR